MWRAYGREMTSPDESPHVSDDDEARARAKRWRDEVSGHGRGYQPSMSTQARIDARRKEDEIAFPQHRDRSAKPTEIGRVAPITWATSGPSS